MSETAPTTLSETEIRPEELRAEQEARFAADIDRLVAQRDSFVEVACPACESEQKTPYFQKYGLDYVLCANCETVYISPRPTPVILEDFYMHSQNYEFWNTHIFPASENSRRAKIFRPRAERVAEICHRYNVNTETLVEVGAGFGTFCEEIRSIGLFERLVAIEPTPSLARTCRERGLDVLEQPFETVSLASETADVVVAFEVIEHLFAPRDFMMRCWEILRPGGLLVVTCPNVRGFDIQTLGALSDAVDCEHLNYFHRDSLSALARSCDFEVLETQTPGKLDAELVRKKVLSSAFSVDDQPFLKQVLVEEWERVGEAFQVFLADNGLSSHLWLVARKT